MKGRGIAFGAVSIVNAIAAGKGATASVRLRTEAEVELEEERGGWRVSINGRRASSKLAVEVVRTVLRKLGSDPDKYSGEIRTRTNIPIGVGLKSSSSSSIAVSLATLASLGKKFASRELLDSSVEASVRSGASITGALDDAASCLLGGVNHADNLTREIVKSEKFSKRLRVVILVPKGSSHRTSTDIRLVRKFSGLARQAFRMSAEGNHWGAMTMNGLLYSSIYRYDPSPAVKAVGLGALGAGLSGTGPAVAAVFDARATSSIKALIREWRKSSGAVILTETNNQAGGMVD